MNTCMHIVELWALLSFLTAVAIGPFLHLTSEEPQ